MRQAVCQRIELSRRDRSLAAITASLPRGRGRGQRAPPGGPPLAALLHLDHFPRTHHSSGV